MVEEWIISWLLLVSMKHLKSLLAAEGSPWRYLCGTAFKYCRTASLPSAWHLEQLSLGQGTRCPCPPTRIVWVRWARQQNAHRKTREQGGDGVPHIPDFFKRMRYATCFFLSQKGNERGCVWLAASSVFCQRVWGVYNLSSSNPSSAVGEAFLGCLRWKMRKVKHGARCLTCSTSLVLVVFRWLIPGLQASAHFAPRMDGKDQHLIKNRPISATPLFCSFQHF